MLRNGFERSTQIGTFFVLRAHNGESVVEDEEAGGRKVFQSKTTLFKLKRSRNRVRCAGARMSLLVNPRAKGPQVYARRQFRANRKR